MAKIATAKTIIKETSQEADVGTTVDIDSPAVLTGTQLAPLQGGNAAGQAENDRGDALAKSLTDLDRVRGRSA